MWSNITNELPIGRKVLLAITPFSDRFNEEISENCFAVSPLNESGDLNKNLASTIQSLIDKFEPTLVFFHLPCYDDEKEVDLKSVDSTLDKFRNLEAML